MDQNNNQNVQTMPNQNIQMAPNQNVQMAPNQNTQVNQQPMYYQPVNNARPTFVLDEKMLDLFTNVGISGGLGFCCYFIIFLIERLISKIATESSSFDTVSTLSDIYDFINSYILVFFPIIVIGLSLFLLLKNKKK